ncbi:hypothetical protein Tco_1362502 [Tanacetum coccineum]
MMHEEQCLLEFSSSAIVTPLKSSGGWAIMMGAGGWGLEFCGLGGRRPAALAGGFGSRFARAGAFLGALPVLAAAAASPSPGCLSAFGWNGPAWAAIFAASGGCAGAAHCALPPGGAGAVPRRVLRPALERLGLARGRRRGAGFCAGGMRECAPGRGGLVWRITCAALRMRGRVRQSGGAGRSWLRERLASLRGLLWCTDGSLVALGSARQGRAWRAGPPWPREHWASTCCGGSWLAECGRFALGGCQHRQAAARRGGFAWLAWVAARWPALEAVWTLGLRRQRGWGGGGGSLGHPPTGALRRVGIAALHVAVATRLHRGRASVRVCGRRGGALCRWHGRRSPALRPGAASIGYFWDGWGFVRWGSITAHSGSFAAGFASTCTLGLLRRMGDGKRPAVAGGCGWGYLALSSTTSINGDLHSSSLVELSCPHAQQLHIQL